MEAITGPHILALLLAIFAERLVGQTQPTPSAGPPTTSSANATNGGKITRLMNTGKEPFL